MTLPPTGWWPCERCGDSPWPNHCIRTTHGYLCGTCRGEGASPSRPAPNVILAVGPFRPSLIKAARKDAGLSPQQLAVKMHRSERAIENWEQGRRRPSDETLFALSAALGCGVKSFFEDVAA